MQSYAERPRIGYRGGAKDVVLKVVAVIAGAVTLISAFVVSLMLFAIAFAGILVLGGYLWWKTRDLRRQIRAQMQAAPQSQGNVIEGVVISRGSPEDERSRTP